MILVLILLSSALITRALPTPEASPDVGVEAAAPVITAASVERFYDEELQRYVERIAEEILEYNERYRPATEPPPKHERGGKHGGHAHHHRRVGKYRFDEDDAEMQADQPQPGQLDADIVRQRQRQQEYQTPEDRDKLAMTNNIKDRVLSFITKGNGSKTYGERDRSFYANCDQPKSTEDVEDLMKLYFTLTQLEDTIAVANLRLYRKNPSNQTYSDSSDLLPCVTTSAGGNNPTESEKLYRVTLYYHVKGQKKHKLKRKIGDSKVISESMSYVNLNVLHGVRELNKGKLFGVMVQIEDQFGTVVKASDFFKGPTCTVGMPTPQPLPTVFEEAHANLGRAAHAADFARAPVQPKLDIKTIQLPSEDADALNLNPAGLAAVRCRHVQLRHAHSAHHQSQRARLHPSAPPLFDERIMVQEASQHNGKIDMDALLQEFENIKKKVKKQQEST